MEVHKNCPIHKKGDKFATKKYGPKVGSKVFHAVIYDKITGFIHSSISVTLFGFKNGRSYLSQLLVMFVIILKAIDTAIVLMLYI